MFLFTFSIRQSVHLSISKMKEEGLVGIMGPGMAKVPKPILAPHRQETGYRLT